MATQNPEHVSDSLLLHPKQKRVEINLGYACNNRCVFCSEICNREQNISKQVHETLTTEFLLKTLKDLYGRGFQHLTFLGGEPTIRKDFPTLVAQAKRLGFQTIMLTTNGRMLRHEKFARTLQLAGITRLYLSLHGHDAETHDAAVQSPGAFDQVCLAMENLKVQNMPFSLSSVIYNGNVQRLPDMMRHQLDSGAQRLFWAFVRPIGGAYDHFENLVPTYKQLDAPLREALKLAQPEIPITIGHVPLCRLKGIERYMDELYWSESAVEREVNKFVATNSSRKQPQNLITKGHYKIKPASCTRCRYRDICEGVHTEYVRRRGTREFVPVSGTLVEGVSLLQDPTILERGER